jgi:hypothetical protein
MREVIEAGERENIPVITVFAMHRGPALGAGDCARRKSKEPKDRRSRTPRAPAATFSSIFDSYDDLVGNCLHANRKQVKGSILTFSPMTHFHLLRWTYVVPSSDQT